MSITSISTPTRAGLLLLGLLALTLGAAYGETPQGAAQRLREGVAAKVPAAELAAPLAKVQAKGLTEAQAYGVLGAGYVVLNKVEPALYCFAQAVSLDPTNTEALNNLGFVLLDQGQLADAAIMLNAAYAKAPQKAEVCLNLGKLAWKQGDKLRALGLLKTAAQEQGHPNYAYALAKAQFYSGQKAQAKQTLEGNLGRFPTHQPSLALYQKAAGKSYTSQAARAMAREALALGAEVQTEMRALGQELDVIASQCGDASRPGTQWANHQLKLSKAFDSAVTSVLGAQAMTDEILAINALTCYGSQTRLLATCYHQFLPGLYLWRTAAPRPGLKIEWSGTYAFRDDYQPLGANFDRYHQACLAMKGGEGLGAAQAAARVYLDTMPQNLAATARTYNQALDTMFRADAALWSRYADFVQRHHGKLTGKLAAPLVASQKKVTHEFLNPAARSGCHGAIVRAQQIWQHYLDFHRQELHGAAALLKQPEPPVDAPVDELAILRAWMEASAQSGVTATLKINFEVAEVSFSSDGTATVRVGQGIMAIGSYNALHDNWTGKFGLGVDIANPGVVGGELSTGGFLNFDSVGGFGCEFSASASLGAAEVGWSSSRYFASGM